MLSDLVIAIRAVIASKLGIFLYPTLAGFLSVSELSFSTLSVVSGSPPLGALLTEAVGEDALLEDEVTGETERVVGALTAIESALDVLLLVKETCEPVRRSCAARRGRDADVLELEDEGGLMRAAS